MTARIQSLPAGSSKDPPQSSTHQDWMGSLPAGRRYRSCCVRSKCCVTCGSLPIDATSPRGMMISASFAASSETIAGLPAVRSAL